MLMVVEEQFWIIIIGTEGHVLCTMWQDSRDCFEAVDGFWEMFSYLQVWRGSKLIYTRRNGNLVAHLFAKKALKLDVLSISLFATPYLPDWDYSIRVSFASIMKWQELFFKRKTGASTSLVVIPSFLFFKTNTKMMLIVNKKTSI